ncbi:hypothetical protein GUJ93_ZPchr0002g24377 [Zizania palustris]|uniref:Uncharacterized protein n=1 Tax=Zizania palustris TaxID=103762 RepID=A0A8J5S875_ZIZPA|nr:hypothetical protein GUJ93_ZPchr0002g24377 [Zizania palustris]
MGCSVTGVKRKHGPLECLLNGSIVLLRLGPKVEDVSKPVNPITFLFRFLMETICDAYYVLVADCYSFCSSATTDVLQWLSGNATKNLGILAQYWQLLAQPKNLKSSDSGYSENDMVRFRAEEGHWIYDILLHST